MQIRNHRSADTKRSEADEAQAVLAGGAYAEEA
eukprot:SAG11_NODE_33819_length_275_cov_0.607955_1_plen_32_part_10